MSAPSDKHIMLASGPTSRSSTSILQPCPPPIAPSSSTACAASCGLPATTTPLPAARQSSLTTTPPASWAIARAASRARSRSVNASQRAVGIPARSMTPLA